MRPADIKCRLCGKHYGEPEGCPTCTAAKRNIDWPAMADSGVDLLPLAQQAIRLMKINLDRLEHDMTQSLGGRTDHYYEPHANQAMKLGRSLSFMLAEARKLEERDEKKVANMSFGEKVELYFEFLNSLPQEHQRTVAERMAGLLAPMTDAEFE